MKDRSVRWWRSGKGQSWKECDEDNGKSVENRGWETEKRRGEGKESERGVGIASGKIKESSTGNPERGLGLTEASTDVYWVGSRTRYMQHYHLISSGLVSSPVYSPMHLSSWSLFLSLCFSLSSLFLLRLSSSYCLLIYYLFFSLSPSRSAYSVLLPSHFLPCLTTISLSLFSLLPPYPAPSRRPFNPISSARGYLGPPVAPFSLGAGSFIHF